MRKVVKHNYQLEEESGKLIDHEFIFTQLSPKVSLRTSIKIARNLGGPLGKTLGSMEKTGTTGKISEDYEVDMSSIGNSIESLFTNMKEDDAMEIVEVLLTSVIYHGQPLTLTSLVFIGNMSLVYKLAYKSLEVNFSDFFLKGLSAWRNRSHEATQPQM